MGEREASIRIAYVVEVVVSNGTHSCTRQNDMRRTQLCWTLLAASFILTDGRFPAAWRLVLFSSGSSLMVKMDKRLTFWV